MYHKDVMCMIVVTCSQLQVWVGGGHLICHMTQDSCMRTDTALMGQQEVAGNG